MHMDENKQSEISPTIFDEMLVSQPLFEELFPFVADYVLTAWREHPRMPDSLLEELVMRRIETNTECIEIYLMDRLLEEEG
jgi:hypothetical protein